MRASKHMLVQPALCRAKAACVLEPSEFVPQRHIGAAMWWSRFPCSIVEAAYAEQRMGSSMQCLIWYVQKRIALSAIYGGFSPL